MFGKFMCLEVWSALGFNNFDIFLEIFSGEILKCCSLYAALKVIN